MFCQGIIQVFREWGLFPKIEKRFGHLGIKISSVSCKIWEFCMILKKFCLGVQPIFCLYEYADNPCLECKQPF